MELIETPCGSIVPRKWFKIQDFPQWRQLRQVIHNVLLYPVRNSCLGAPPVEVLEKLQGLVTHFVRCSPMPPGAGHSLRSLLAHASRGWSLTSFVARPCLQGLVTHFVRCSPMPPGAGHSLRSLLALASRGWSLTSFALHLDPPRRHRYFIN